MRRALRAIDLVQVLEGELELRCETFDARFQLSSLEGRKLIEERLDEGREDYDHEHLETEAVDTLSEGTMNDDL